MNKPILIYTVDTFPIGGGFNETELEQIHHYFEQIYVITSNFINPQIINFKQNVRTVFFKKENAFFEKIKYAFLTLTLSYFYSDIFHYIKTNHKPPSLKIIKDIVYSLTIAHKLRNEIKNNILKNSSPDQKIVLYSFWFNDMAIGLGLLKKYDINHAKLITRAHGSDLFHYAQESNFHPFRFFYFSIADMIISVSKAGQDYLSKRYHFIKMPKIIQLYLGSINQKERMENKMFDTEKLIIYTCSAATELKRIMFLPEILTSVSHKNIFWKHYGGGDLLNSLKARAEQRLSKKTSIHFEINDWIEQKEILNTMIELKPDFLLNISKSEGVPVSMMEAMSLGIPCIGTNVGGVSELIVDGVNGFLLKSNPSPIEVAEKINDYINLSNQKKSEMRINAYNTWNSKFNAEKNYTKFVEEILAL